MEAMNEWKKKCVGLQGKNALYTIAIKKQRGVQLKNVRHNVGYLHNLTSRARGRNELSPNYGCVRLS